MKKIVRVTVNLALDGSLALEEEGFKTRDRKEGETAFFEKCQPNLTGR